MDKKVLIAIVLSIAVLLVYPYALKTWFPQYAGKGAPSGKSEEVAVKVTEDAAGVGRVVSEGPSASTGAAAEGRKAPEKARASEKITEILTTVETPLVRAVFSNIGGSVKSWELKDYRATKEKGSPVVNLAETITTARSLSTILSDGVREMVVFSPSTREITIDGDETAELVYTGRTSNGILFEKTYRFSASAYMVDTTVTVTNPTDRLLSASVETTMASAHNGKDRFGYHTGALVRASDEVTRYKPGDAAVRNGGTPDWIGMEDKYFLAVILPERDAKVAWRVDARGEDSSSALVRVPIELLPDARATVSFSSFIGPKKYGLLSKLERSLVESIQFGWFSFLAKPLLVTLNFFQRFVVNYGIAIILLTVLIKIIFYPLTKKSLKSMKDMQRMQPQMALIKEKYKDDKQAMNKEMMELYKRHKINPLGGCLPMLLQIPVFIGLYEALYVAIELRHAPFFLWITDLSSKDPYYISPLLMGGSMFLQQKMSPTSADPTQAKMMMFMPLIFTVMFLKFPSGLVIYWL
ncbi:MAG: membrane protein insertase YidC, partial [Thermodesulfobacteriota bacterium]